MINILYCCSHVCSMKTVKLFSVRRLLFWCVLCSLCGYEWMLLFANWTPHALFTVTLPWSNSWSDELSEPASPELNGLFPEVNPGFMRRCGQWGWLTVSTLLVVHFSQKQWRLRRRCMLHVYVHTSAADNGNSYLLKLLLQLSFRESFCIETQSSKLVDHAAGLS